ncbi:MAG: CocE/NonD family hydrolase [Chitinophagaceae bacterium]|nr:CocE/NonD family hydrolase [Chitinophagaceae bacterium]
MKWINLLWTGLLLACTCVKAQKATVAGELTSPYPTLENLSLEWPITGDDNLNGSVKIEYREKGSSEWLEGMPLRRVPADSNKLSTNLGRTPPGYWGFRWINKHAGSIFFLKPGACYEIKARLNDPDGGSVEKTIVACTRALPLVCKSDSIVNITPGEYDTLHTVNGIENKRIVYRSPNGRAQFKHIDLRNRKWVTVEGLAVYNSDSTGFGINLTGAENIVIQHCEIKSTYGVVAYLPGANSCIISNNVVTGPYPWGEELMGAGGATNGEGIQMTGSGNIICYNTVSGFRDCISLMEDEHAANQSSIDIYNNEISNGLDDGIEADFCFSNCRIYKNRITNCFVGLSSQPSLGGPTYFIRNVMYNIIHSGFKLKRRSRGDVVLHNTLLKVGVGFGGNDTMDHAYFRNNLAFGGPADFKVGHYGTGGAFAADMKSPGKYSDLDYDAVGIYQQPYKAVIGSKKFSEVEKHGLANVPFESTFNNVIFPLEFKKEFAPPDLTLKEGSMPIDAGQVIPNINNNFKDNAPDIGAYEYREPVPVYGASRYYAEETTDGEMNDGKLFTGHENLDNPKFAALIKKYRLDTVVKDESDELKRILLLRDWIRSKIKIDNIGPFPGDGSAESILDEAIKGHGFHCAHYSLVQQAVMNAYGYVTRFVRVDDGGVENGEGHHAVNEIWLNSFGKWFMSDTKYNYHFEKKGVPQSALEIHQEYLKNGARDLTMVRGRDRVPVDYYPEMKRTATQFARIYTWISWSQTNDDYTAWPGGDTKLIVYGDDYFLNHTWMRNGKPHWAYHTPFFDTVYSKNAIEWAPNTVSPMCVFNGDTVSIKLQSNTPNFLRYEMKNSFAGEWVEAKQSNKISLSKSRCEFYFRAINKAGVAGPVYHLMIRKHPAFDSTRVNEQLGIKVPMRDGINLSTNIFRPAGGSEKFPVLLLRTPYNKGEKGRHGEYNFVAKGYAVVVQDCRGRYESEGEFDPFQNEANDGFDTQEWIGRQPWCNGSIVTFGSSYEGATQWLPSAKPSKYLKGMFTSKTFAVPYNEVYYGGAFRILRFVPWGWQMSERNSMSNIPQARSDSAYKSIPLINSDERVGLNVPFLKKWMQHPAKDQYWAGTSNDSPRIAQIATFNVAGWFDSFIQGTLDNYMRAVDASKGKVRHRLVVGPWIHGNEDRKTGDLDFGEFAVFDDRSEEEKFFDEILKGKKGADSTDEYPVKLFVMGINKWRYEKEWPLKRAAYTKFYLSSSKGANSSAGDGRLDTTLSNANAADTFTYDPMHPIPNAGNLQPVDQSHIEKRKDVLVFSTGVLEKDVEVTGPLSAVIYASSSAVTTDFTAKLLDVYPDGRAFNLREGIIRSTLREADTVLKPIKPGKVYRYDINLWSISNVFRKGHRIRLEISSSNFPMFDRNLNTCLIPATCSTAVRAFQKVFHNKKYPSHILLPVVHW